MELGWKTLVGMRCPGKQSETIGWCIRIREKMGGMTVSFFLLSTERTHLSLQPPLQRDWTPKYNRPLGQQTIPNLTCVDEAQRGEEIWLRTHSKNGWCFQEQVLWGVKERGWRYVIIRSHSKLKQLIQWKPRGSYRTAHHRKQRSHPQPQAPPLPSPQWVSLLSSSDSYWDKMLASKWVTLETVFVTQPLSLTTSPSSSSLQGPWLHLPQAGKRGVLLALKISKCFVDQWSIARNKRWSNSWLIKHIFSYD